MTTSEVEAEKRNQFLLYKTFIAKKFPDRLVIQSEKSESNIYYTE